MKKDKANLSRKITVRFTDQEYGKLHLSFRKTTKRKLSEYVRFVLLEKPVTVYTRNQSSDQLITEFIRLRTELSAIGNNINQAVKKLHTLSLSGELKTWVELYENYQKELLELTNKIFQNIAQLSDKWLQE